MSPTATRWLLTALVVWLVGSFAWFGGWRVGQLDAAWQAATFEPWRCTILEAGFEAWDDPMPSYPDPKYRVRVRYRYEVAGQTHEAATVAPGYRGSADAAVEHRRARRWTPGAEVPCWVSPGDPSVAYLELGVPGMALVGTAVLAIFVRLGLVGPVVGLGPTLASRNWTEMQCRVSRSRPKYSLGLPIEPGVSILVHGWSVLYHYRDRERQAHRASRYDPFSLDAPGPVGPTPEGPPDPVTVTCWYDPDDPTRAVLDRGLAWSAFVQVGTALLVLAFVGAVGRVAWDLLGRPVWP